MKGSGEMDEWRAEKEMWAELGVASELGLSLLLLRESCKFASKSEVVEGALLRRRDETRRAKAVQIGRAHV